MSGIKKVNLSDELQASFLSYSEEVIKNRAIPDIRDGLKPVHRRILWSMWGMGCKSNSTMKKCARVVGECFKYHPHSDLSVYDALVRMAQPFAIGTPLISSQGNFGSIDSQSEYASSRYAECKLSKFCEDILFADIDFDTVDFIDNYTGEFKEPTVFPARIPLILLTGSNGIAVGMKTEFLPHNIKEVCAGLLACLKNPQITIKELMKYIPAPDFPLGGLIEKNSDLLNAYSTGNGSVLFKSKAEEDGRCIVFNSIPYSMDKCAIIKELSEVVREGKVEGITEVRDESENGSIRICLDLKRTANYAETLNAVYNKTSLSKNIIINTIAISDQKPKLASLIDVFQSFIKFRRDVIKKRTISQKIKADSRYEIITGILIALNNTEEILKTIRTADEPILQLKNTFKMTENQANYVFNMPVKKFSKRDTTELYEEKQEVETSISEKKEILKDSAKIDTIIEVETKEISKLYGVVRKTMIV